VNNFLAKGKQLYCFFIDYSKAFDYVVHDNLWFKLLKCGIRGKIITVIRSMYLHVRTKVCSNGVKSNPFYCKLGVRQGECLSPFLFAIYVNDLERSLEGNNSGVSIGDMKFLLLLYADDVVIFANSADEMQQQINKLSDYCTTWRLRLNTDKSKILVFNRSSRFTNENWAYGENVISQVRKFSYLGLVFSANGSTRQMQATLADQARKALFQLYRMLHHFKHISVAVALDLFDKFIGPILNYAAEVWGFSSAPDIERVHLSFCKRILGVKKSTQNDFVYGLLGRFPMQIGRHYKIIKYWINIVSGRKSSHVNILYNAGLGGATHCLSRNWAQQVKHLLCSMGFGDVWRNQGVADPEAFLYTFKQRLTDIFQQDWKARLTASPRARFYSLVVNEISLHPHLDAIKPKSYRFAFTRLIASSHRLRVETGRWERPVLPFEQRLCRCCNKLGDEFHCLLECSRHTATRRQFIPRYYRVRPSMFKCIELLQTKNPKKLNDIGKYLYKAFSDV
jgi:hypothetical protein